LNSFPGLFVYVDHSTHARDYLRRELQGFLSLYLKHGTKFNKHLALN